MDTIYIQLQIELTPGATKEDVMSAIESSIPEGAELVRALILEGEKK